MQGLRWLSEWEHFQRTWVQFSVSSGLSVILETQHSFGLYQNLHACVHTRPHIHAHEYTFVHICKLSTEEAKTGLLSLVLPGHLSYVMRSRPIWSPPSLLDKAHTQFYLIIIASFYEYIVYLRNSLIPWNILYWEYFKGYFTLVEFKVKLIKI